MIKKLAILVLFIAMAPVAAICQSAEETTAAGEDGLELYYFHFSRRCATCIAVEEKSKEALQVLYPEKVEQGVYVFRAVNLDEEENEALAEKLGVTGQTLLLVKGGKKEDITSAGFMYARTNPEKLQEEIARAVGNL